MGRVVMAMGGRLETMGALLRHLALGPSCSLAFPTGWTSRCLFFSLIYFVQVPSSLVISRDIPGEFYCLTLSPIS